MPLPLRCVAVLLAVLALGGCRSTATPILGPTNDDLQRLRIENERLRRDLEDAQRALSPTAIEEEAYRGQTVEELAADLFFESGSASLTEQGRVRLDGVAMRLKRDFPGRQVRVEGHSDNQPIGPSLRTIFPTNWELSAARATAVVRYLQDVHVLDPAHLEAVGMSAYYPAADNATSEGRAQNRRVRIAVLPD